MPDIYRSLLDATIDHLEDLRSHGVRYVPVGHDTLKALANSTPPPPSRNRSTRGGASTPSPRNGMASLATAKAEASSSGAAVVATPGSGSRPAPLTDGRKSLPPGRPSAERTPEEKTAAMKGLRDRVLSCRKCEHLAEARQNVVFGIGDPNAKLMFVGEAPGADEDTRGEPFVGRAGQLLTKIIEAMGLSRDTVFIGNILKCRPNTPGQTSGNRKPTPSEMATCMPHLLDQIDIVQPRVIVALGATAVEGLFGKLDRGITRLRGAWMKFHETPVMPTYHPAYLLRNQSPATKRQVWEDMLQVMERLEMSVSAKQRNFFLKRS